MKDQDLNFRSNYIALVSKIKPFESRKTDALKIPFNSTYVPYLEFTEIPLRVHDREQNFGVMLLYYLNKKYPFSGI